MEQGKIVFYGPESMKEQRKYEFWDCYCVSRKEAFRHNTTTPVGMSMKLIPGIFGKDTEICLPGIYSYPINRGKPNKTGTGLVELLHFSLVLSIIVLFGYLIRYLFSRRKP